MCILSRGLWTIYDVVNVSHSANVCNSENCRIFASFYTFQAMIVLFDFFFKNSIASRQSLHWCELIFCCWNFDFIRGFLVDSNIFMIFQSLASGSSVLSLIPQLNGIFFFLWSVLEDFWLFPAYLKILTILLKVNGHFAKFLCKDQQYKPYKPIPSAFYTCVWK